MVARAAAISTRRSSLAGASCRRPSDNDERRRDDRDGRPGVARMTTAQTGSPGLDRIQTALDRGDVADARRALLELSDQELELLSAEIGEPAVRRAQGTAARGPRRAKLGRVLVL